MPKFLSQIDAQKIDEELMSTKYGFSIDQLMELAGFSVACAIGKEFTHKRILVVVGPGNNGGDALVASRHLKHFGYEPTILYPKQSSKPLFQGLVTQNLQLEIPFIDTLMNSNHVDVNYDVILDGIFGFSFQGAIRPPFDSIIQTLKQCTTPIVSIDIPSGWHVEKGNENGLGLDPQVLISLTAPKQCAQHFRGANKVHYIGGRFVSPSLAKAFDLDLPSYPGMDQCVRIPVE